MYIYIYIHTDPLLSLLSLLSLYDNDDNDDDYYHY